MAAPMRFGFLGLSNFKMWTCLSYSSSKLHRSFTHIRLNEHLFQNSRRFICSHRNYSTNFTKYVPRKQACLLTAGVLGMSGFLAHVYRKTTIVFADADGPLNHKPIRSIRSESDHTGLKLTLFQYQTCPFCCKVRAYLDYKGFSYNVVEVNSVWRTQTKWSKYKKVPVLVVHGQGPDGYLQMNDSSVITSALQTYLEDQTAPLDKILAYYPSIEAKNKRGKTVLEYPNKYFIMFGGREISDSAAAKQKVERKWRSWTDDVLVHMLSPNVYRTMPEAIQAFNYFSEVGQWYKVFTTPERLTVIYVGATAMYFIGKMLKMRYDLKADVRESLYDACREWTKAVGSKQAFMGGEKPDLSDLAVYGVMSSIEGCTAFDDMLQNTRMGPWFYNVKKVIHKNKGFEVDQFSKLHQLSQTVTD